MFHQLNPQIPLITPKGKGWAVAVIDYSQDHDLIWVVFQDDDGSCWSWRNQDIRIQNNITFGRTIK